MSDKPKYCHKCKAWHSPTDAGWKSGCVSELPATPCSAAPACQWLVSLEESGECGKPATHIRLPAGLKYCTEHALKLAPYAHLQMLAQPNAKLTDGGCVK